MQPRMVIFYFQVDGDLYRGIENKLSAYSSLYLSNLLTCHTLKNEIFVKDFSTTMQPRMVEFDMQVDDDLLYHETENQPLPILPCICPNFLSFHTFEE